MSFTGISNQPTALFIISHDFALFNKVGFLLFSSIKIACAGNTIASHLTGMNLLSAPFD